MCVPAGHTSLALRPRWLSAARFTREPWLVRWALLMGLLNGLCYIFLVPPWQHYEEPAHFEVAWMIFTRHSLPGYGAYDNAIRHSLLASMIRHDFFRGQVPPPNPEVSDQPIFIAIGQADTAPLFHILMTLPVGLLARANVEARLYAVRFTSLGFYLLTLWIAYRCVSELVPEGHPLRWTVPAGLALLPAFTDIMTAFNDDVGATLFFSLYLWAAVRLIMRGPSIGRVLAVLVLAGLCAGTKTTVLLALPFAPVAIVLSLMWRRWHPAYWVVPLLGGVVAVVSVFGWGEAASWYPQANPTAPNRLRRPDAVWGQHVFGLPVLPGGGPVQMLQPLLPADVAALHWQPVTLGAWIWATSPGPADLPSLWDGQRWLSQTVMVGTQPAFYAMHGAVPFDVRSLMVSLSASPIAGSSSERVVYFDGLVLAAGRWPIDSPPVFSDARARQGQWDGRAFVNYVRNASAEGGAPWVRPWAATQLTRLAGAYLSPTIPVAALFDPRESAATYRRTGQRLLETFWARFGWGQVGLAAGWYTALGVVSAVGVVAGAVRVGLTWLRKPLPWKLALVWLAAAALASWGTVLTRGLFTLLEPRAYIPVARYAFPVIVPTMLLLMGGWQGLLGRPSGARLLVPVWGLLVLDLASLLAIYRYYSGG